ncbi:ABC transporter ATP-binding protein [Rubrivirga sp. IMCC45206]|uniref:ABC transporter ATP-binding protein n=1 Tax=Rubrivirga sp. IMCC45206 TaxID=3391614 RepID=UPI00399027B9
MTPTPIAFGPGLRRVLTLGRPYAGRLALALALYAVSVVANLTVPLGIRALIDGVLTEGAGVAIHQLALVLLAVLAAQALFSLAAGYTMRWTGERVVADLRARVYSHLQGLHLRFFDDHSVGTLTSRLTSDVAVVRGAVTESVVTLILLVMRVVGSLALMVALNWRLTLFVGVVVPLVLAVSKAFSGPLRRLARRVQDRLAEATAIAQEGLSTVRLVQAFGRADYESARYREAVERVFRSAKRRVIASSAYGAVVDFLFLGAVVAIFWYGGLEVVAGRLSAGDLVAFLFYAFTIGQGIAGLAQTYAGFQAAIGASERLFEILERTPEVQDPPGAVALTVARGHVQFDDVSFAYVPGVPVLDRVTIDVAPGEAVALVGPSGCGKSTLLGLLLRFFDPTAGRVRVDGQDVRGATLRSLREQVAVVTQDVILQAGTVYDNIRYGRLDATEEEVRAAAAAANADAFIERLPQGYQTPVGERGVKLSGGQKQRIAIARALLKDAPVLLLDEATSSLDGASEAAVQDALARLSEGRTTITVTHKISTAAGADRIYVMGAGSLIEVGSHDELVARGGHYATLARLHAVSDGARSQPALDPPCFN